MNEMGKLTDKDVSNSKLYSLCPVVRSSFLMKQHASRYEIGTLFGYI